MAQEQLIENRNDDDQRHNQQTNRKPIWTVTGTAAAIQIFLITSFFLCLFIRDYVDPKNVAAVFIESEFSLAIVIVVVVHAIMYYKQAKVMEAQLQITNRTFDLLERPSLGVKDAYIVKMEIGMKIVVVVEYQNGGHLPARSVRALSGTAIMNNPAEGSCPDFRLRLRQDTIESRDCIAINAVRKSHAETNSVATAQDIDDIKTGIRSLVVYGFARYGSDGLTEPYFVEYYARYNRFTDAFEVCSSHNDAN